MARRYVSTIAVRAAATEQALLDERDRSPRLTDEMCACGADNSSAHDNDAILRTAHDLSQQPT